ncbi:hypothetical protein ASU32_18935 [Tsukamurella tyrosinosolvens]|nr:hypothetical protein ASU32_18935 [Tsukamurella tyrosinosolvens]
MPRAYPAEFRARAVALVCASKQAKQTAVELVIHPRSSTIVKDASPRSATVRPSSTNYPRGTPTSTVPVSQRDWSLNGGAGHNCHLSLQQSHGCIRRLGDRFTGAGGVASRVV